MIGYAFATNSFPAARLISTVTSYFVLLPSTFHLRRPPLLFYFKNMFDIKICREIFINDKVVGGFYLKTKIYGGIEEKWQRKKQ